MMRPLDVWATTPPATSSSSMRPLLRLHVDLADVARASIAPFEVEPRTSTPAGTSIVYSTVQRRPQPLQLERVARHLVGLAGRRDLRGTDTVRSISTSVAPSVAAHRDARPTSRRARSCGSPRSPSPRRRIARGREERASAEGRPPTSAVTAAASDARTILLIGFPFATGARKSRIRSCRSKIPRGAGAATGSVSGLHGRDPGCRGTMTRTVELSAGRSVRGG